MASRPVFSSLVPGTVKYPVSCLHLPGPERISPYIDTIHSTQCHGQGFSTVSDVDEAYGGVYLSLASYGAPTIKLHG